MTVKQRISKDFAIFKRNSEINKAEVWRNVELLTYLVAVNEISLEDANYYIDKAFSLIEGGES